VRTEFYHGPMRSSFLSGGWRKAALVLILLPGSFVVLGCATERGSGNIASETRSVSGFSEVALYGTGALTIRQTGSESLTIEAEDNVLPHIQTNVKNNRLTIEANNTMPTPTKTINYELTVKDLSALELQGAGSIDASDISTDSLNVSTSGAGDVTVAGEADSQEVDISGAGSYQAEKLATKKATVDLSGAGEAIINASDELNVAISGLGSVEYVENPTVSRNIAGVGEVRRR
jgi:hypothetical protein